MSETIIGYAHCSTNEQDLTAQRQRLAELGEIGTTFDVFELPGEPGLSICTYSVEEGSPSADKFALLASWAATQEFGNRHRHRHRADLTHDQETATPEGT